jgi:2-hydroxyacyl-CoA lyase 1
MAQKESNIGQRTCGARELAQLSSVLREPKRPLVAQPPRRKQVDGHHLVAQSLQRLGVTHVYCVSGTPIRETFAACTTAGIRPIGVRHQQAGVMMALAQNYVAGRLTAVSILSAGPAVTNAVTSVLVARDNGWPVIVLGGRRPLSMQGMGSFQDLDAIPIFNTITKWSALVESTSSIPFYLERAFRIATSGRPGPVYLDLPEDVVTGLAMPCELTPPKINDPALDFGAIKDATTLLASAARPAIIIGDGVRWSEPYEEFQRLVNGHTIPFVTAPMARGYLPDDHPLCYNSARAFLLGQADVVLLLEAKLDWTFRFGAELAEDVKLIQVNVDPSTIGLNKAPRVGIVGDTRAVLQQILAQLQSQRAPCDRRDSSTWPGVLERARARKQDSLQRLMSGDADPMAPHRMMKEIREFLPRDAISILDGNICMAAAQQVLPAYLPVARMTCGSNGCLGVGIPFGIGAKLARPERLAAVICGDTAFAFSAMEMETAVRHGIPLLVIVANNDGNCGALMQNGFGAAAERITTYQPGIRYDKMMAAFGGHGENVNRAEELKPALQRALVSGKPACVNVQVDPYAAYPNE